MTQIGDFPLQIDIDDEYAYIALAEGIAVYSITDPFNPVLVDNLYIQPGSIEFAGLTVYNDALYYVNQRYLYTVDKTSPENLTIIGSQEFTETGSCWGNLAIANNHLFVVTTLSLNIFDLTVPLSPELVYGGLPTSYTIYDLAIDGNLLVLNHSSSGKWSILDISDPAAPSVLYTQLENQFYGLYSIGSFNDNRLIILDNGQEGFDGCTVHLLDVSDISSPEISAQIQSIPGKTRAMSLIDRDGSRYALIAQDNTVDVGQESFGLFRVLNVTNAETPELVSTLELPKGCVSIASGGTNYAFISAYDYSFPYYRQHLILVNIEDLQNPYMMDEMLVNTQSVSYQQNGNLSYYNGTLYMTTQNDIKLFKVSSGILDEIGSTQIYGLHGFGVFANNSSHLYIAGGSYGFMIYNLSDPSHPIMQSFYDTPGLCYDVYEQDGIAYCADYDGGLAIFDVSSNMANLLSQLPTSGDAVSVLVVDKVAYIGLINGLIEMVDVSDPVNPSSLGWYLTNGGKVTDIQYNETENLFFAADNLEFVIFQSDFATSVQEDNHVLPNNCNVFPIPANKTINAEFDLSGDSDVVIRLLDLNGRVMENVLNKNYPKGSHAVTINTESLPRGLYFLQIVTETTTETVKFIK
jgi:hypothetical protein